MSSERGKPPDWGKRERQRDLDWIGENLDIFQLAASLAYADVGRGALVIDTTIELAAGGGLPFAYISQEQIEEYNDKDISRMVHNYAPGQEFVLVFLKADGRTSTYRVRPVRPDI